MNAKKIILSAFYELLQKQSISSISVSMIIEAAEISKPTFYRYFYNKFDLLNQIFEEILAPMQRAGDTLTWGQALEQTFANIEENRAIFRNGFKSEEQYYLRNDAMLQVVERASVQMLQRKGVDTTDAQLAFAIRSSSITHVAAMCGWAGDNKRSPIPQVVELLLGTLPGMLSPYYND